MKGSVQEIESLKLSLQMLQEEINLSQKCRDNKDTPTHTSEDVTPISTIEKYNNREPPGSSG